MLPTLSSSLDGVLHKCKRAVKNLIYEALEVLPVAAKLRNELLFRECLIFLLGPYNRPEYTDIDDPKLRKVGEHAFTKLSARLGQTQKALWDRATSDISSDRLNADHKIEFLGKLAKPARFEGEVQFPVYYRALFDTPVENKHPFRLDVAGIMECGLNLVRHLQAGVGD